MEQQRPRWRIRISTLMLLIIFLSLALTVILESPRRAEEARRLEAAQASALQAEAWRLMQRAMEARAKALEREGLAEAILRSSAISEARESRSASVNARP